MALEGPPSMFGVVLVLVLGITVKSLWIVFVLDT